MTRTLRPALLSLCLLAAVAAPALAAGPYENFAPVARPATVAFHPGQQLSNQQVYWRLNRQGYHRIGDLRLDRGYLHTRAVDASGRRVLLTVSPWNGSVVNVRFMH